MQKKVWQVQPTNGEAEILAQSLKVSPLIAQVLINRQLHKADNARSFLSPKLTDLIEPEQMYGVPEAAEHVQRAIEEGKKISIYGDYDVGRHHQRGDLVASAENTGGTGRLLHPPPHGRRVRPEH
jgi:single-stranded-DNA-specific exonuclease